MVRTFLLRPGPAATMRSLHCMNQSSCFATLRFASIRAKRGLEVYIAVDTLGHLLALKATFTPGSGWTTHGLSVFLRAEQGLAEKAPAAGARSRSFAGVLNSRKLVEQARGGSLRGPVRALRSYLYGRGGLFSGPLKLNSQNARSGASAFDSMRQAGHRSVATISRTSVTPSCSRTRRRANRVYDQAQPERLRRPAASYSRAQGPAVRCRPISRSSVSGPVYCIENQAGELLHVLEAALRKPSLST
jgi:hypothetical protein